MTNSEPKKPALYEKVAESLIKKLEEGTAPWQKPWDVSNIPVLPYNPTTGNNYKGLNVFALMLEGREDPRWMTFKQADANKWSVKKGEKGTLINFYKFNEQKAVRDESGKPEIDEQGKQKYITVQLESPIVTSAYVFNAEQINGVPELVIAQPDNNWKAIDAVENIVKNSGADVRNVPGDKAFYRPAQDYIQMPIKDQFPDPGLYYATLLHELGHWTGHEDRLDRSIINKFGSEDYAKEELRAEIGSLMLGTDLQIGHDPERHASYVASWIQVLKNDPFEIHRASADAQKIFDYVKGIEQKITLKEDLTTEPIVEQKTSLKVEPTKETIPKKAKTNLNLSEVINYKDENYKVMALLRQGALRMENQDTGRVFVLKPSDKLFTSLIEQKENSKSEVIKNNQTFEPELKSEKEVNKNVQTIEPDLKSKIDSAFEIKGAASEGIENPHTFKR
jgi:antirestriction protein ArdC